MVVKDDGVNFQMLEKKSAREDKEGEGARDKGEEGTMAGESILFYKTHSFFLPPTPSEYSALLAGYVDHLL